MRVLSPDLKSGKPAFYTECLTATCFHWTEVYIGLCFSSLDSVKYRLTFSQSQATAVQVFETEFYPSFFYSIWGSRI